MHRSLQLLLISVGLVSLLFGRKFLQNRNLSQQLTQLQEQLAEESSPVAPVDLVAKEESRPDLTKVSDQERRKSRYFNNFLEYCRKSNDFILPNAEFSETLEPNEELAVLFELSERQMNELKAQSQRTREQIYAWEQERIVDVEEDGQETKLTCRIPLGDELAAEIKEDFLEGIETVLGEDNFTLIEHIAAYRFQPFERERVISIATTQDSYSISIQKFDDRGDIRSSSNKSGTLDSSLNRVPERYRHLFAIEFEEE